MNNRIVIFLGLLVLILTICSCGREESGQLVGVIERPSWNSINPYGMVYIPSGTLHIVKVIKMYFLRILKSQNQYRSKVFSWMIRKLRIMSTDNLFIGVRDSIAHVELGDVETDDYGNDKIDWEYEIDYADEALDGMFYEGDMAINNEKGS